MRSVRPLVLLILTVVIILPASAQEDEKWYYAIGEDRGSIIAFTAGGEINVLIDGRVASVDYARRLDAQTVFVSLTMPTGFGPVVLTPDEALILTPTFSLPDLYAMTPDEDTLRFYPLAYHAPYLVLTTRTRAQGGPGLIANLETGEVDLIGDFLIDTWLQSPRISEDGQLLRYLRFENEEGDQRTLIERSLATDEERDIYNGRHQAFATSDEYGEHWLLSKLMDNQQGRIISLLSIDGTQEVIGESTAENLTIFGLFGNMIYETSYGCEDDCSLTLTPLGESDPETFSILPSEGTVQPLFQPDESRMVVRETLSSAYWLLSTDEDPKFIGYGSFQRILTPYSQTWSLDGRFLLVVSDDLPSAYAVYDFAEDSYVVQGSFEDTSIIAISYGEGGFVVSEDQKRHQLYSYADSSLIPLPDGDGFYFDVLSNGDVLYTQVEDADGRTAGLYRYSPEDDTFTLLVINSRVIVP